MSKWTKRPRALLLPSLLALASLLCWRRPEKTVAILLGLACALASPLGVDVVRLSVAQLCSDVLLRTTLELLRSEERPPSLSFILAIYGNVFL